MKLYINILSNIRLIDDRTSYPETFKEELNYQCGRMLTFASLITFSWLTYIPIDLSMHPDKPIIITLRIGFPVVGTLIFFSRFIAPLRKRYLYTLTLYAAYMAISNAVLTGSTKGDPAYIGGFLFILTLLALAPLQKAAAYTILVVSLVCFFFVSYVNGMNFRDTHAMYSLNDIFCVTFIVCCFIHILNNTRYVSWYKSRQVEIGDETLKVQKIYSESLEKLVQERTRELEIERNNFKLRNDILENDIRMAKHIHEQLMPVENPVDFIHSFYKPMDLVGGDFFDFIKFRNSNRMGIFISDVSGHGLAAAFITSMIKTIILQAGERKLNPAELLRYINDVLCEQIDNNFVTAFYGIYDPASRDMVFANAGHHSPFIIGEGSILQLKGHKTIPLGITKSGDMGENKQFKNSNMVLPGSSKLLLYTDGLMECRPLANSALSFEESSLDELLLDNRYHPCDIFIRNIYGRLAEFRGGESFEDDICLICLDIK